MVYHANYLAFFETGRVEAMRAVGALYGDVVRSGLQMPVVEAQVRYVQPARFDDELLVSAWVAEIGKARFSYAYAVHNAETGALVATGRTLHTCVDAVSLRAVRMPPEVRVALERLRREGPGA